MKTLSCSTNEDILDWAQIALSKLPQDEIISSFFTTGIYWELTEFRALDTLHTKLSGLLNEYLDTIDHQELLKDHYFPY